MTAAQGWQARACVGLDTERFYGPGDSAPGAAPHRWERAALAVCQACPARAACLAAALEFPAREQHGVI
ncbi:MAG: WhiB family transcriptional regulator, partial [Actinomycetota bacterium]|nr:WhiB family transcriptional regulator [Actinomycetota bacterium]